MDVLFLVISPLFKYFRIIAQFDCHTSSFIFCLSLFFYNWLILLHALKILFLLFTLQYSSIFLFLSIIAHFG